MARHRGAFRDRRSAGGMVMRAAQPVQRMPEAKLLGASKGCAEPHGHVGRQHRRYAAPVSGHLIAEAATCSAFRDRRSAAGMVMREAQPVKRILEAKLLGASKGCAEPHGHVGR
jgi:hypothetical protein